MNFGLYRSGYGKEFKDGELPWLQAMTTTVLRPPMTLPVSRCAYKCVEVAEIRKQERPGGGAIKDHLQTTISNFPCECQLDGCDWLASA